MAIKWDEWEDMVAKEKSSFELIERELDVEGKELMKILDIKERNVVAPRVSDLLKLNLIFVSGSIKNKNNHTTNIFKIIKPDKFNKPKMNNELRNILVKLNKLSQDDLRTLLHSVEEFIDN